MTENIRKPTKPRARAVSAIIAAAKAAGASEVRFLDDGTAVVRLTNVPTLSDNLSTDEVERWFKQDARSA